MNDKFFRMYGCLVSNGFSHDEVAPLFSMALRPESLSATFGSCVPESSHLRSTKVTEGQIVQQRLTRERICKVIEELYEKKGKGITPKEIASSLGIANTFQINSNLYHILRKYDGLIWRRSRYGNYIPFSTSSKVRSVNRMNAHNQEVLKTNAAIKEKKLPSDGVKGANATGGKIIDQIVRGMWKLYATQKRVALVDLIAHLPKINPGTLRTYIYAYNNVLWKRIDCGFYVPISTGMVKTA